MVKCIFSLGIIDKKLIIPLLTIILYIIYFFYYEFFPIDDVDVYFHNFGCSIGEIFTFFIPYIFKFEDHYKNKNEKKKCTKKNIIDYSLFLLFYLLRKSCILYEVIFITEDSDSLWSMEAFEIIIICLITKIFLKYKYYIHHLICLVIFLIAGVIMDIILKNFKIVSTHFIIFIIIYSIVEASNFCYDKYMIEVKYHSLYNLIFFRGVFDFFFTLIIFGVFLIISVGNNNNNVILQSLEFYDKSKIVHMIIRISVGIVLGGILTQILEFQTINLFNPNFIFVCYEISKISSILYYIEKLSDLLFIIPFTFQIIILLFYIEIFEFNFCNLNKNTKKNILLREKEDIRNTDYKNEDIIVELKEGYLITDKDETNEKNGLIPEEESVTD